MSIDPRCRHDRSARELAAGMFDEGRRASPSPRAGARGRAARGAGGVPKKTDGLGGGEALPSWGKALAVAELSGQGHAPADLPAAAGLARSTYYYCV